jgi:sucrose-phosphate synthase
MHVCIYVQGVFINPALVEPFGLTLIEAAAHGLPMVATKNGGPVDIHKVFFLSFFLCNISLWD